jgi:hypothetical protein
MLAEVRDCPSELDLCSRAMEDLMVANTTCLADVQCRAFSQFACIFADDPKVISNRLGDAFGGEISRFTVLLRGTHHILLRASGHMLTTRWDTFGLPRFVLNILWLVINYCFVQFLQF